LDGAPLNGTLTPGTMPFVPAEPAILKALSVRLKTGAASHAEFEHAIVILIEALLEDQEAHAATIRDCIAGGERELDEQRRLLREYETRLTPKAKEQPRPARDIVREDE
jgi:hypothetical protein